MLSAGEWIDRLGLQAHPEGGFYRESYRSPLSFPGEPSDGFPNGRSHSTAIYFLLEKGDFSAFHRIRSDELWHFYSGSGVDIHVIDPGGNYDCLKLGLDVEAGQQPQAVVPAGCWFASEVVEGGAYALVGCTVAPGFDFADFEMAGRDTLASQFPEHRQLIERLTRP